MGVHAAARPGGPLGLRRSIGPTPAARRRDAVAHRRPGSQTTRHRTIGRRPRQRPSHFRGPPRRHGSSWRAGPLNIESRSHAERGNEGEENLGESVRGRILFTDSTMRIEQIDLNLVRLPLIRPFRTSSSVKIDLSHPGQRRGRRGRRLGRVRQSPTDPYYCPETVETCWHILKDFLGPLVIGREWATIDELVALLRQGQGEQLRQGGPGDGLLGRPRPGARAGRWPSCSAGTARQIVSGVSLGIEDDMPTLLGLVDQYVGEGYRRVKLKIGPGQDVEVVRAGPRAYPGPPAPGRRQLGLHARRPRRPASDSTTSACS